MIGTVVSGFVATLAFLGLGEVLSLISVVKSNDLSLNEEELIFSVVGASLVAGSMQIIILGVLSLARAPDDRLKGHHA